MAGTAVRIGMEVITIRTTVHGIMAGTILGIARGITDIMVIMAIITTAFMAMAEEGGIITTTIMQREIIETGVVAALSADAAQPRRVLQVRQI